MIAELEVPVVVSLVGAVCTPCAAPAMPAVLDTCCAHLYRELRLTPHRRSLIGAGANESYEPYLRKKYHFSHLTNPNNAITAYGDEISRQIQK